MAGNKFCTNCGANIEGGTGKFCESCGADLSGASPPTEPPVQKPVPSIPDEQPPKPAGVKKGSVPRIILAILAIVAVIVAAALVTGSLPLQKNPVPSPAAVTTPAPVNTPPVVVTTATSPVTADPPRSTVPAPASVPVPARKITDGFWCRDTTINIGKAPTDVKECYQFFMDGTYKWGYTPGWPMGKSLSCSGSPDAKCVYSLRPDGKIEVQGGYSYTVSGDALIDPHDPPYFIWTATGIP